MISSQTAVHRAFGLTLSCLPFIGFLGLLELSLLDRQIINSVLYEFRLPAVLTSNLSAFVGFLFAAAPLVIIETLAQGRPEPSRYGRGILFWALTFPCNYLWAWIASQIMSTLNLTPLLSLTVTDWPCPDVLLPICQGGLLIVSLLVFDGLYYWFHRLQHTVPFLWTFHRVHHAISHLNCINNYHHPLEELFRIPFVTIPLALLITIQVPTLALVSSFMAAYGLFIHTNSKVTLVALRPIFADNAYHRIHHSIHPEHHDRNFAAFFPIWDYLGGTMVLPKHGEFPAVGLTNTNEPETMHDYLSTNLRPLSPITSKT